MNVIPIHELLYMSQSAYNENYIQQYMRWCIDKSCESEKQMHVIDRNFSKPDLQSIIANTHISKWYAYEYEKLEQKFIQISTPQHGSISCPQVRQIFSALVSEIFTRYPNPLIESARKLSINAN